MSIIGTKISSTFGASGVNGYKPDYAPHICPMSDGYKLALFQAPSGSTYAIFNGTNWAAATGATLITNNILSFPHAIVQAGGNDVYIWYVDTGLNAIGCWHLAWSTGSHSVTSSLRAFGPTSMPAGVTAATISAAYDSTDSYWYVFVGTTTLNPYIYTTAGPTPSGSAWAHSLTLGHGVASGAVVLAQLAQSSTAMFAVQTSGYVTPITAGTGGTITVGAAEKYLTSAPNSNVLAAAFDANGYLDLFYEGVANPVTLNTVKRTAASTYATPVQLDANIGSSWKPMTVQYNAATGDVYVYYQDSSVQTNGELYVVKRIAGAWQSAALVAGGDALGYASPSAATTVDGTNSDFIYTEGASAYAVYAVRQTVYTAPNTPTFVAPAANAGASGSPPTPTLQASAYSNSSPGDAEGGIEFKVIRVSDSVVMWDSGMMATSSASSAVYGAGSNTGDSNYAAPANLSYGVQYQGQVRYKDSLGNLVSAYSPAVTFTLYQAPVPVITSVASPTGGTAQTSSPVSLAGQSMDLVFSVTQPQSDHLSAYRILVYDSSRTTIIQDTGTVTLTPAVASGATVTATNVSLANIHNSTQYRIEVDVTDAVTGTVGASAQWVANAAFTPPAAPTLVTATPIPAQGVVLVRWTNGAAANLQILRRLTGSSAWTDVLYSGPAASLSKLYDTPSFNTAYDYGVQMVDPTTGGSTIVTYANVTLGINGKYGVSLMDVTQFLTVATWVGMVQDSDWRYSTGRDLVTKGRSYVPAGGSLPIRLWGKTGYHNFPGRRWYVPDQDKTPAGYVYAATVLATLHQLASVPHNPVLYRDPRGYRHIVNVQNYHEEVADAIHNQAWFDLEECRYLGGPVVVIA